MAWHNGSTVVAGWLTVLLIGGFAVGLVGLVAVTGRMIGAARHAGAQQISLAIATGIGLHNLSEGLAIGASTATGQTGLAIGLMIGFAAHNATEGFGILGPTAREGQRVSWRRLGLLGLIGGGPTFVGVLVGSAWTSPALSIFVLAMATGALLFVLRELLAGARGQTAQVVLASVLVLGLAVGWGTELLTTSPSTASAAAGTITEADGDGDVIAAPPAGQPTELPAGEQRREAAATDELHEKPLRPSVDAQGVAHYTFTASAFDWQPYPGRIVHVWGYNHQVPGPLLRWRVGEQVTMTVHNQLSQPTTVHWHGLAVPNAMDGAPDTQQPIPPGGQFTYAFTVTPQMLGTHFYHSHINDDFQIDAGLRGPLIVDPATGPAPGNSVDALYQLGSFKIGGSETENAFTMDGLSYPDSRSWTSSAASASYCG